jgi:hypothetical protein
MGQQPSKETPEDARLSEICEENMKTVPLISKLQYEAILETRAGKPAAPGSQQARLAAAWAYYRRLDAEASAIRARRRAQREGGDVPPMPEPTPPLELPPLAEPAEPAAPAPASAPAEQPDTPIGTSSFSRGQQSSSSSGEEAAHPGGAAGSDEAPLLASGSGRLARGLRRRQGHQDCG